VTRCLVVDDDAGLRTEIVQALRREGFDTETAADGEAAVEAFAHEPFDLIVTDLAMPRKDGAWLVDQIRKTSGVPILILTVRSEEREKVRLLDAGADDYVVKPFGVSELLARVRALLRRRPRDGPPVRMLGNVEVDWEAHRVRRDGEEIRLTPTELALLKALTSRPGIVWTHRQLIAAVWGGSAGVTNDVVRVHIGSLRRKIESDPNQPRLIRTEPWVGYRLTIPD
jgi:two-component system KDP operon response regulator KdpE